jgi:cupin fold WbuC family metalloprotein
MTLHLQQIGDGLFLSTENIVCVGPKHTEFLKAQAWTSTRKRARICAHRDNDDELHEMLIAISKDSYIRPHRHRAKIESFHVIEGVVDVVIFTDSGTVLDVIELGDNVSGRYYYYRLPKGIFHTLIVRSEFLVVHEVTNGPFRSIETEHAPFAPAECQLEAVEAYKLTIQSIIEQQQIAQKEIVI